MLQAQRAKELQVHRGFPGMVKAKAGLNTWQLCTRVVKKKESVWCRNFIPQIRGGLTLGKMKQGLSKVLLPTRVLVLHVSVYIVADMIY